MEFIIRDKNETIVSLGRKIGYRPMGVENNEYSLVRELDRNKYPRFHIYAKKDDRSNEFHLNLHLDQKMPSYKGNGAHAHSGEYEGDIVEREAQRIRNILKNS